MAQLWSRVGPFTTVETVWPFVRPDRPALIRTAIATLLLTAVEISIPLLTRAYVDWITGDLRWYEQAVPEWGDRSLIFLLLGAAVARGGLLTWQRALAGGIGERTAARLRSGLWSHLQGLPIEKTQQRGSGRLLVRFVSDIRSVQRLVTEVAIQGAQDLLTAAIVLLILVWLNWWMAIPALLLLPAYAAIFGFLNPELRRHSRAARRRRTRLAAFLNERIVGMKVVKAQVREEAEAAQVRQLTRNAARRGSRLAESAATLQGAAAGVVTCSVACTLALAPGEIAAGRATGGTLVAFIMLLGLLAPIMRRVATLNRSAQEAHVSITRVKETLDQRVEVGAAPVSRRLRITGGHVKVRGVRFAGDDGSLVLNRVSLDARRGELVALVGSSGSGKSTLLDLLLRFKQPTSGRIVIDGRLITNVSLSSLRTQVGWVPQEAVLFDGTFLENITYGVQRLPSTATVQEAIRRAGLADVAARLPGGLEGSVGPGGQLLSHGERQRVALARALVADQPILVLDEMFAGADAAIGKSFAGMLRELATDKTVIVATQQLPILLVADRIYVLRRGRVVERGTHRALVRRGRAYPRLVATGRKRRSATKTRRQRVAPAPAGT